MLQIVKSLKAQKDLLAAVMVSVEEHCVLYEVRILCKAISSMTVSFREMVARV